MKDQVSKSKKMPGIKVLTFKNGAQIALSSTDAKKFQDLLDKKDKQHESSRKKTGNPKGQDHGTT